jgi:hypothetical protein
MPTRSPLGEVVAGQGNAESPGSNGASPYLWAHAHPPTRLPPTPPRRPVFATVQGLLGRDSPMGEEVMHPNEICDRIL